MQNTDKILVFTCNWNAYSGLEPSPLESIEKLEQLRVLWHGMKIHVGIAQMLPGGGVDTREDLEGVAALLNR